MCTSTTKKAIYGDLFSESLSEAFGKLISLRRKNGKVPSAHVLEKCAILGIQKIVAGKSIASRLKCTWRSRTSGHIFISLAAFWTVILLISPSNCEIMRLHTPEISWHGKEPVYSVDFSKVGPNWRLASAGADNDVKVQLQLSYLLRWSLKTVSVDCVASSQYNTDLDIRLNFSVVW